MLVPEDASLPDVEKPLLFHPHPQLAFARAAGLFAAIPALVGYNYFSQRIRQSRSEMEDFVLDLLNLTERNFT